MYSYPAPRVGVYSRYRGWKGKEKGLLAQFARGGNDHRGRGLAGLRANSLDGLHDILAFNNCARIGGGTECMSNQCNRQRGDQLLTLAENNVFAIEPRGLGHGDEELRAVGVGTSVSHGKKEGTCRVVQDTDSQRKKG